MVFSQTTVFSPAALRRFEHLAELYAPHLSLYWTCRQLVERDKAVEAMQSELQQFIADITLMNSLTAVDEVYASIAAEFINRFHFDMVNILLEEDGELAMVHTSFSEAFAHLTANWEPFRRATRYSLTVRDGQSALIFLNNQRFLVEDAAKILHLPMSDKDRAALTMMETPHTFIIAPIRLDGNAIGVLWLATLGDVIALPENDLALIDLLMSFISTAIRNARAHMTVGTQKREIESLNTELQHKLVLLDKLAQHDSLTGLHNFGAFEAELKSRTSEYLRTGSDALSIILFDIDHFKLFNDSFGHPAGNEALQEIAQRLNKAVRDMDFTARYGGEEFVALLPHCTLPDAIVIAERIRGGIADQPVTAGGQSHRITISGGVAQYRSGESREQFFGRADRALYAAKEDGRNRMTADGS
jgi:diguanylate cyclase (GGDEF)-like protein